MDEIDWGMIASGVPTPAAGKFPARAPMAPVPPPMQSPIAPEVLARNLAARGVPPPPVDVAPPEPIRLPDNNVGSSTWRQDFDMANNPGGVGAALTGKTVGGEPKIYDQNEFNPIDAQAGSTDVSAQSKTGTDKFAETLKGVKAPAGPELQRLGTPGAPRPTTQIKGGDLMALLQMLTGGGGGANKYELPSTLGAAIRK